MLDGDKKNSWQLH